MPDLPKTTLFISMIAHADISSTTRRISEIEGVTEVEFNYINQKLRIRYHGDGKKSLAIQAAIRKIIANS